MSGHDSSEALDAGPADLRQRARRFLRESVSGSMTAIWMLAYMLTLGLIAFGPLGPAAVDSGVRAAFAAAIFGNLTAALFGSATMPNEVPRASTVLVFASFVLKLANPGGGVPAPEPQDVLFLAAACLFLSGLLQIAFGLLDLGSVARFVPYTVVAGFMTGLAVSLAIYDIPELLGLHHGPAIAAGAHEPSGDTHGFSAGPLVVGVATIAFVLVISLRWSKAPSRLLGIVLGTLLAALLAQGLHVSTGPTLPPLSGALPLPDRLLPVLTGAGLELLLAHRYEIVATAFVLAVVGSLDSLLSAVGEVDGPLDAGHAPSRLLITLGFGNMASALFGGVPVAYSSTQAMARSRAGGRKTVTTLATSAVLLLLLLYGGPILAHVPVAVFAGVNITIAIGLIDRWARDVILRTVRHPRDRDLQRNLVVIVFVAAITAAYGPVPAVVVGMILSMALFIAVMNRSLVRSIATRQTRASRRLYPRDQMRLLQEHGDRIAILELEGAIFFGTAERLSEAAEKSIGRQTRYLILDLFRVSMIDASGALMLERLSRRLRERDVRLLLTCVTPGNRLGAALVGASRFTEKHHPDWFEDTDRALEWAERQLLAEAGAAATPREIPLEQFALLEGLAPDELDVIKPYLDRQRFAARSPLFHEGDIADRLYLLARGAVSVIVGKPEAGATHRVVTMAPGVIFGESAVLEGGRRAVTAMPEEEALIYSLSRKSLEAIRDAHPDLYRKLLQNLLKHLTSQLRLAAGMFYEGGDTIGEPPSPAAV